MRKMSFVCCLVFVACQLILGQEAAKAVAGGTARTAALGGGPYNPYLNDYTDIFTNPANATAYSDLLYSDVGYSFTAFSASGQYLGWTLGLGDLAVGLAVGRREGPFFAEFAYGTGVLFTNSDNMKAAIDANVGFATGTPLAPLQLYGAYKAGPLAFGATLYRSSWSLSDDGAGTVGANQKGTASNSQTGFKVGALVELSSSLQVDASLLMRFNSSDAEFNDNNPGANPSNAKYSASGTEFGFNGRVFLKATNRLTLVPIARFSSFGYKPEITSNVTPGPATPNTKPNDYGRTEFEVGVGVNTRLENGMVSVGLSFQSIQLKNDVTTVAAGALQTTKNTRTWTDLPKLNMGAELQLLEWLIGRFGYFKRFSSLSTTVEPPTWSKTETSASTEAAYLPSLGLTTSLNQQLSAGLGIKLSRIHLDGYVGERFIAAGPGVVSGNIQDMFAVLSLSYKF